MQCDEVAVLLPGLVDGSGTGDRAAIRHVETCLRCQSELVQYRKLLRVLHQLRTEVLVPAPGVLTGILSRLEEAGETSAVRSMLHGRRVAYVGALAAATAAAGAAGAIVLASRSRRMRLAG
jgi:hypothetical protein